MDVIYDQINKSWKLTCKIILGQEVGELEEFKPYLSDMVDPPISKDSVISGKPVYLSRSFYSPNARFIDMPEANVEATAGKLSIDDIKDIDSVLSALSEKMAYCGNKNLGRSMSLLESDMCQDSVNVFSSQNVIESKSVAYSNGVRASENAFGCQLGGEIHNSIHSQIFFFSRRCFDSYVCVKSTDLYSCFNCKNSTDAMFCFNQRAVRNAIGNIQLEKDKYLALKSKLQSEIAQMLKEKKSYTSIFEMASKSE